jgi:Tfp pilus assembly protein PilV
VRAVGFLALLPLALSAPLQAKDSQSDSDTDQSASKAPDEQSPAEKPKQEKKICKRQTVTGEIRMVVVCKTQSQIDAERATGQDTLENMQRQLRIQSPEK